MTFSTFPPYGRAPSEDVRVFSVLAPVLLSMDIRPGDIIALRAALPGFVPEAPAIVAIAADEDGDEALLLRYFDPPALLITKSTLMSEPEIHFPPVYGLWLGRQSQAKFISSGHFACKNLSTAAAVLGSHS